VTKHFTYSPFPQVLVANCQVRLHQGSTDQYAKAETMFFIDWVNNVRKCLLWNKSVSVITT